MPTVPDGLYPVHHQCGGVVAFSKRPIEDRDVLGYDDLVWLDKKAAKKDGDVPDPLCEHCGFGLTNGATIDLTVKVGGQSKRKR